MYTPNKLTSIFHVFATQTSCGFLTENSKYGSHSCFSSLGSHLNEPGEEEDNDDAIGLQDFFSSLVFEKSFTKDFLKVIFLDDVGSSMVEL